MIDKTKEQILKERKEWYSKTFVLFEIVKCLKHRELCFLTQKTEENKKAVRYLVAVNVDYFKKHFKWFNVDESLINVYHSVASFKEKLPIFSYNLIKRSKEDEYKEFNENYLNYVDKYNLFFDFDGKENVTLSYMDCKILKEVIDYAKIPYYIVNSSFTGFHIVIPSIYMPDLSYIDFMNTINNVVNNIRAIYRLSSLDPSVVDYKRVQKCPYSYVCDGSICLPLNDFDFKEFNIDKINYSYVSKNIMIKNRGLLIRDHGLTIEELKKNVIKFINDYK